MVENTTQHFVSKVLARDTELSHVVSMETNKKSWSQRMIATLNAERVETRRVRDELYDLGEHDLAVSIGTRLDRLCAAVDRLNERGVK